MGSKNIKATERVTKISGRKQ